MSIYPVLVLTYLFWICVWALIPAYICGRLAESRNKDENNARIMGFFFGIFAVAYYLLVSTERKKNGLLIKAKEHNGIVSATTLEVYSAGIKIFFKNKKFRAIPISNLIEIYLKKASFWSLHPNGQIQIIFENESKEEEMITISFTWDAQSKFEEAKEIMEEKMQEAKKTKKASSGLDELEKLAKLKEKGIITKKEFETKKKRILNAD